MIYEVSLLNKSTFQSKKVTVEATSGMGAELKARRLQPNQQQWASIKASPLGKSVGTKYVAKGLMPR